MTDFDLGEVDRLLKTTKQVRKRLDLTKEVPVDLLLDCIEVAGHAPVGGNLERNRWIIITDAELKAEIAHYYAEVGRPYLAASSDIRTDDRTSRVIDSSIHLIDHMHEVPPRWLSLYDLTVHQVGKTMRVLLVAGGDRYCPVKELPARSEREVWDQLGPHFTLRTKQRLLSFLVSHQRLANARCSQSRFYTGDSFYPAPRRSVDEVTYLNGWKQPVR